jgi:predicted transglutaminase-like protease
MGIQFASICEPVVNIVEISIIFGAVVTRIVGSDKITTVLMPREIAEVQATPSYQIRIDKWVIGVMPHFHRDVVLLEYGIFIETEKFFA